MVKLLFTALLIFTLGFNVQAQTWLKMAGKKVDTAITLADGQEVKAGSTLELHEGTTADGNDKHIYSMIGTKLIPLGYGMDYKTITVDHIWCCSKKTDQYFALAKISDRLYIVEVDKALKSGEVIKVINEEPIN